MALADPGTSLRMRFEQAGDAADLEAAIAAGQEAVDLTSPGNPRRAVYLANLAASLGSRFGRAGDGADLDAAVGAAQEAVALAPPGHPNRGIYLSGLANALDMRFSYAKDAVDLDAGCGWHRALDPAGGEQLITSSTADPFEGHLRCDAHRTGTVVLP